MKKISIILFNILFVTLSHSQEENFVIKWVGAKTFKTSSSEIKLPNFQKEYEILGNNFYLKNEIQYGDVIIIEGHNKTRGDGLVKRVIGLPGDKIKIQNGKIILNGEVLKQKNDGKFRFNGKTYEREIEYILNDKSYKILNVSLILGATK